MVVIFLPSTALSGSEHERIGTPLTCTVQAPHCAMPQPYLVPVRPTCSRMTHSRGVVGSTSTSWDLPLIVRRMVFSLRDGHVAKSVSSAPATLGRRSEV